jgi:GT2 family glycosyltransferase
MSACFSCDLFQEAGGFNPSFCYGDSYDFFVRALERGPFARIARTLAGSRRHGDAMSMDRNAIHLAALKAIAEQGTPRSRSRSVLCRYEFKLWLDTTYPRWSALKRVDAFGARHQELVALA